MYLFNLVSSALDWYFEGPGFKFHHLQLNFQLEKGCRRDSMQYAIKIWLRRIEFEIMTWYIYAIVL